jgi:hypothetical protein
MVPCGWDFRKPTEMFASACSSCRQAETYYSGFMVATVLSQSWVYEKAVILPLRKKTDCGFVLRARCRRVAGCSSAQRTVSMQRVISARVTRWQSDESSSAQDCGILFVQKSFLFHCSTNHGRSGTRWRTPSLRLF